MSPISPVFALFAANLLLVLGTGLQSVLVPVRAHLLGFSDFKVGALGGAYYVGFVLGCLVAPRLVRRVGHIRAFAALAVIAGQVFPLHGAASGVATWFALRLVVGFCLAGLSMIVESWVNEKSLDGGRGRSLSIYLIVTAVAYAAGQFLLCGTDPSTLLPFLGVCLCVSLSVVPLAVSAAPAPKLPASHRLDLGELWATSPVGLVGCLFIGLVNGAFWSLAPLSVQLNGGASGDAALFVGAAVLGGACAQWPMGQWSDRTDRRRPIVAACCAAAAAGLCLALVPGLARPAQLALAAGFGVAAFPLYGLCVAHANDHAAGRFVQTSGGLLLTFGVGAAIGPLVAGPLVAPGHSGGLFLFTAGVHLALAAFVLHRMVRRRPARGGKGRPIAREFPAPSRAAVPGGLGPSSPRWAAR